MIDKTCALVFVRALSPADNAAIAGLSELQLEQAGLQLTLVSSAPLAGGDFSAYCTASGPISSFITDIQQDGSENSMAGILAGGLALLLGAGGGCGGGLFFDDKDESPPPPPPPPPPPDRVAFTIDDDSQNTAEEESFALGTTPGAPAA